MRFLIDENVRRSVIILIEQQGHEAVSVIDIASSLKDEAILKLSVKQKRILITNDLDFGELVFYRKHSAYGVILLRLQDETKTNVLTHLKEVITLYQDRLVGNFIVITETNVKIRPLF